MKFLGRLIRQFFCFLHKWEHTGFSPIPGVNFYRCRKCGAERAWLQE